VVAIIAAIIKGWVWWDSARQRHTAGRLTASRPAIRSRNDPIDADQSFSAADSRRRGDLEPPRLVRSRTPGPARPCPDARDDGQYKFGSAGKLGSLSLTSPIPASAGPAVGAGAKRHVSAILHHDPHIARQPLSSCEQHRLFASVLSVRSPVS